MGRVTGSVHLVGSLYREIENWGVPEIFAHCASALGPRASMLPDGEVGDRQWWVTFLAFRVMYPHPDMEVVTCPDPNRTYLDRYTAEADEAWLPKSYLDMWRLKVRRGVKKIEFGELGYAKDAKSSYAVFRDLRDKGVIPKSTRFMIALPLTESAMRQYVTNADDFLIVWDAFENAMLRELKMLFAAISAEDVSIQWDAAVETLAVEGAESFSDYPGREWKAHGDPVARFEKALGRLSTGIPERAWMGVHMCYGSLSHKFAAPLTNMTANVTLANAAARASKRTLDFLHLPVPLEIETDEAYRPLAELKTGDTKIYLGAVRYAGGVEGTLRRASVARKFLPHFGIATACGFGRRPSTQNLDTLLAIHRDAADRLGA